MSTVTAPKPTHVSDSDGPAVVRLSVNIGQDVAQRLRDLVVRKSITTTEGIRRAITLWKLIEDELEAGSTVQIVSQDGKRTRELLLL